MTAAQLEKRIAKFIFAIKRIDPALETRLRMTCLGELGRIKNEAIGGAGKPALTTVRSTISAYRAAIRRHLGKNHPSLAFLRLRDADQLAVGLAYRKTLSERHKARKRLDPAAYLETAYVILESADRVAPLELAGALIAVTGRRSIEVLQDRNKDGDFWRIAYCEAPEHVVFRGQRKTRGADREPYPIPLLVPADLVLGAIAQLRARYPVSRLSSRQVEKRSSSTLGRYVAGTMKRQLSKGFHDRDGKPLTPKELRAAYAAIAYWQLGLRTGTPPMSYNAYAAAILGHSADDLETSLSYDVFVIDR